MTTGEPHAEGTVGRSARRFVTDAYYHLPEGLRMAILVRRRSALWRRAGIVFIHIPKAAGTSMNLALYGRFMGHARAIDVARWAPPDVRRIPSFALTRNPWDRLVSAYRFAKRGGGIDGTNGGRVWKPEQYRVPEFQTFERFVREWLVRRDVRKLDFSFRPQSLFVCDRLGGIIVDHAGRVEDLAPTMDFIRDKLGRIPSMPRSNRSGEPLDYRRFYTPDLAELVGRIYARDIALFGYDF